MNEKKHTYIFVRTDIPIQHQMAQACHGALETGKVFNEQRDDPDSIVILKVANEKELLKAHLKLMSNGIKTAIFYEPDWDYGYTSFGTMPLNQDQRKYLKGFSLWK